MMGIWKCLEQGVVWAALCVGVGGGGRVEMLQIEGRIEVELAGWLGGALVPRWRVLHGL
jgi:hypothetical protein